MAFAGDSNKVYEEYCSSCHGKNLEDFLDGSWAYGSERDDIFKSIKYGNNVDGMPAYDSVMTDKQIYALTDFILSNTNKTWEEHEDIGNTALNLVVEGVGIPWGMVSLPDGGLLISDRGGKLYRYDDTNGLNDVSGLPEIYVRGQGGLLDVKLDPDFVNNAFIYLSYSKPDSSDADRSTTAVMKAKLKGNALLEVKDIFIALPYFDTARHYGSRLVFDKSGYLYITVGDRGNRDVFPQSLNNSCGKVHRINSDGSIPSDNPFVGVDDAVESIYSYGHRNPQGMVYIEDKNEIWLNEHGPRGGDEINKVEAGKNYGWPLASFGINYTGTVFTKDTSLPGMEDPDWYWVPSIAPCGMAYINSHKYPEMKGDFLNGSLKFDYVMWTNLENGKVTYEEPIFEKIGRVRNVVQAEDGYLYVAVENPGRIYRVQGIK